MRKILRCAICGKHDYETRIIHSTKFGMDLCKYHHEKLCRQNLDADNNIIDDKLIINKYVFTIDPQDIPLIRKHKWDVKIKDNTPYLVTNEGNGRSLIKMLFNTENVFFANKNPLDYRRSNLIKFTPKKDIKLVNNRTGYSGVWASKTSPIVYRCYFYNINNTNIWTKEFPRLELAVYLLYLVKKVLLDDTSLDDDYTHKLLDKLTIVDKENIEKYFKTKIIPLKEEFNSKWILYKKDLRYKNTLEYRKKGLFNNEL